MNLKKSTKALKKKMINSSKVLAICALSMAGTSAFAQKGLDFGLKLNVQTSSLTNSTDIAAGPELDFKNKTGAAFGISAGYNFNKNMGAEINIIYSKQGQGYLGDSSKINANSDAILSAQFLDLAQLNSITFKPKYTAAIELTTIKIPILFRFTSNNTKKVFFSSFVGPQINLLTGAKFMVNDKEASVAVVGMKTEDCFKKMTIDGVLGLGAGCNLSKNLVLSIHLRLDYGFGDIEDKKAQANFGGSKGNFYDADRPSTHNATGGGLISLNYKLVKKAKEPVKGKPSAPATKSKK